MIEYRWLDWDEVLQLDPILESKGISSLNKNVTRAIAAFDGKKLIAFEVLQLFPMLGPLWVDKEYRGDGIPKEMTDRMLEFVKGCEIRGFIVIANSAHTEKICRDIGMDKLDSPVYLMR